MTLRSTLSGYLGHVSWYVKRSLPKEKKLWSDSRSVCSGWISPHTVSTLRVKGEENTSPDWNALELSVLCCSSFERRCKMLVKPWPVCAFHEQRDLCVAALNLVHSSVQFYNAQNAFNEIVLCNRLIDWFYTIKQLNEPPLRAVFPFFFARDCTFLKPIRWKTTELLHVRAHLCCACDPVFLISVFFCPTHKDE